MNPAHLGKVVRRLRQLAAPQANDDRTDCELLRAFLADGDHAAYTLGPNAFSLVSFA